MMWLDSLRAAVNQYPGGRPAVAVRLGKADEVLRKELAGTSANHKMGLTDSQHIVEMLAEQGIDVSGFKVSVDAACLSEADSAGAANNKYSADQRMSSEDASALDGVLNEITAIDGEIERLNRMAQIAGDEHSENEAAMNAATVTGGARNDEAGALRAMLMGGLLQDSMFDIEANIQNLLRLRLGRIQDRHHVLGIGTGQP